MLVILEGAVALLIIVAAVIWAAKAILGMVGGTGGGDSPRPKDKDTEDEKFNG